MEHLRRIGVEYRYRFPFGLNGIAVMLLASTINLMFDDLGSSLAAVLDKYQKEHNEIARRWRNDAEICAARLLNAALNAGREATANTMNEGAKKVMDVVH